MPDDLTSLKDDMVAFIEGHGMKRFHGYINPDEVQSVMWEKKDGDQQEGWKDFVELAKAAGATFLTANDWVMEREDVDEIVQRLRNSQYANDEDVEEARWLRTYIGKTGFIQLGWPHQGTIFIFEIFTEWYDRYQRLLEIAEDFGSFVIDESDQDDER